jgi:hypothetical protein
MFSSSCWHSVARSGFFLLLCLLISASFVNRLNAAETIAELEHLEWKMVRNLNDIQVYMKHREGSKIKSVLGKTVIDAPDPYALAAVIEDFESAPEWLHMISEVFEINWISEARRDVRVETRLPWPVKDRDGVVNAHVLQNPDNYDIDILMTQDDTLLPEYKGYIRMPEIKGAIRAKLLSKQRMAFEMEFLMDPGGYIQPWMSNIILKDIPYHSLKKLKKMLLKEEYQNKKSVYESWLKMPEDYFEDTYFHPSENPEKRPLIPVIKVIP